jgi:predicted porin
MKRLGAAAASAAVLILGGAGGAYAADLSAMPVKAVPAAAGPATCTSIADFFTTACQVAAYGIRFYGTIDVGVNYSTNAAPFDKYNNVNWFPGKPSLGAKWLPGFNALTPSNVGLQIKEPLGAGWSFVGQVETAWLPYSGQILNGVHSVANMIGVPLSQQTSYGDSNSQGQFYNGLGFAGFSNDTWGTITAGRQNSLEQDFYLAYDPMGVAPAFSVPGFFGGYAGGGDTENRKDTTAIKYRVNFSNWHFGAYGQVGGYDQGNAAKGSFFGDIGADWNVGPGIFSADVVGGFRKSAVSLGLNGTTDQFGHPTNVNVGGFNNAFMQATISDNTSVAIAAKYQVDRLKLYAGYEWIQFANPSDTYANGTGFNDIAGDFVCFNCKAINGTTISVTSFNGGDKIQQLAYFGGRYALTDSLELASAYYHVWQNDYSGGAKNGAGGTCALATTALGSCSGSLDAASVLLDWKFAPKWDTYIGVLYSKLNGGMDSGFLANSNVSTTAGLRFRW